MRMVNRQAKTGYSLPTTETFLKNAIFLWNLSCTPFQSECAMFCSHNIWPVLNDVSVKCCSVALQQTLKCKSKSCTARWIIMQTHCIYHSSLQTQLSIWTDNYCKLWSFVAAFSISKSNLTFLYVCSFFACIFIQSNALTWAIPFHLCNIQNGCGKSISAYDEYN